MALGQIEAFQQLNSFQTFAALQTSGDALVKLGKDGKLALNADDHIRRIGHLSTPGRDKAANDAVRMAFKDAVMSLMDVKKESDLPKAVQKELKLADFGKGRPLSARRINAVMTAVSQLDAFKAVQENLRNEALKNYPGFSKSPEDQEYGRAVLSAMDDLFTGALIGENGKGLKRGQIDSDHLKAVKDLVMLDLSETPAAERPRTEDLPQFLANHPFVQLAMTHRDNSAGIFQNSKFFFGMRQMNTEQRHAFVSVIRLLGQENDCPVSLFSRFGLNVDKVVDLRREGRLTWQNAYHALTGKEVSPEQIAAGKTPAQVWAEHEAYAAEIDSRVIPGGLGKKEEQLTGAQYCQFTVLAFDMGVDPDLALKVVRGEMTEAELPVNPFGVEISHKVSDGMQGVEGELARDLPRLTKGYTVVKTGERADVADGGTFVFKPLGGENEQSLVSTEWQKSATPEEEKDFRLGSRTSFSGLVRKNVVSLCRSENQSKMVLNALGQGALGYLRANAIAFGIEADEHSAAVWTVENRPNGDVAVTVSQPKNCPLEFKWTFVFDVSGRQHLEGAPLLKLAD